MTPFQQTLGEQKADALVLEDALNHGEALLVVSTSDAENVALPLVTEGVGRDLLSHALVEEWAELEFVLDRDALLGAVAGVAHVNLKKW